jgi:RNA polymerase sigma-70 factor, ECF subfamily
MVSENALLPADESARRFANPKSQSLRERGLIRAAQQGQTPAFDELCQPCMPKLYRTVRRITRNHEDAEDAVQDSLLNAFIHIGNFHGNSSFSTWLTRIAINSALLTLRRRRNDLDTSVADNVDRDGNPKSWNIPDTAPSPETRCAQGEQQQMILRAINTLHPKGRRVVHLQHLRELSLKETAEVLGVSVTTTKSRLFHARAALRKSRALRAVALENEERAA